MLHAHRLRGTIVLAFTLCAPECLAADLSPALAELGVTAEALAANSLGEHAQTIANNVESASSTLDVLSALRVEYDAACSAVTSHHQQLQTDPFNEGLISQYQEWVNQRASFLQHISETQQTLFDQVTANLTPEQKQLLLIWNASAARRVPAEFRVVYRTDEQWSAIEEAIIIERRATRLGEQLSSSHTALLADVRSEPAVTKAVMTLQQHLMTVETWLRRHPTSRER